MGSVKKNSAITYLFALLLLVFSAVLIITAVKPAIVLGYADEVVSSSDIRLGIGALGALIVLLSIGTIWKGLRTPKQNNTSTLIKIGELGELHITFDALNNMIIKASQAVKGVRDITPKIKSTAEGISISLNVSMNPDMDIPAVTAELQDSIVKYLENNGGINVQDVKVTVQSVSSQAKSSRVE